MKRTELKESKVLLAVRRLKEQISITGEVLTGEVPVPKRNRPSSVQIAQKFGPPDAK
jgi:hypothetical protein